MPETVNWTVSVQVPAGPRLSQSGAFSVDAYDKVDVSVAAGQSDVAVELQPGGAGQVHVLVVATDQPSGDLSYKVNATTADSISFDQPVHAFMGAGPVGLLCAADEGPNTLYFTNAGGQAAKIQVLVGRKATA